jgi:hypothetical protein
MEIDQPIIQAGLIRLPGHAIYPGSCMPLQGIKAIPKELGREMVE